MRPNKPHITFARWRGKDQRWQCSYEGTHAVGKTPSDAFSNWRRYYKVLRANVINAHFMELLRPNGHN
jgi:hypothetical protein